MNFLPFNWFIGFCVLISFFKIPEDTKGSISFSDVPPMLVVDHYSGFIALRNSRGNLVWKQNGTSLYEAWLQSDGSIVYSTRKEVIKIIPDLQKGSGGKIVWQYAYGSNFVGEIPSKGGVYTCTPIDGNRFIVTESATYRLIEIDDKGVVKKVIQLPAPKNTKSNHSLRMTTKTKKGNYLVCYFGDGYVLEFDDSGKLLKEINIGKLLPSYINSAYQATYINNGNLLISCGTQSQIIILNSNQQIIWNLTQKDFDSEIDLNWIAQVIQLENGNILVCNYGDGKAKTLAFEITMNKKIVWKLQDDNLKGLSMVQILPKDYNKFLTSKD